VETTQAPTISGRAALIFGVLGVFVGLVFATGTILHPQSWQQSITGVILGLLPLIMVRNSFRLPEKWQHLHTHYLWLAAAFGILLIVVMAAHPPAYF
jgi:putative Mn2+ efflux pump MntP